MKISIILPVYNEEESIEKVVLEIKGVLTNLSFDYEVVAVDDGSVDGTMAVLRRLAQIYPFLKVVVFRKNYGQTAAIAAGISACAGAIILAMDADLQNDPADIPRLLAKLDEGYDVVSGWRKQRQDKLIRKIPSKIANALISVVTGVKLHDYGCTLKAYRSDILKDIKFYGEMHRFMPAYAFWQGGKIAEIIVNHRPRRFGQSKYGFNRIPKVMLDLITVKFLISYLNKPMHFFGKAGLYSLLASLTAGLGALYLKFFQSIDFVETPLPLLTIFLAIVAGQFVLMGLLAEILIRVYYGSGAKRPYAIKEKINL